MNILFRCWAALAACVVLSSIPLLSGAEAAAASVPPTPSGGSSSNSTSYPPSGSPFSLTISPTRLVIGPSQVGDVQQILVVNRGSAPVPVTVQKRDFTGALNGSLDFKVRAPYSASSWLTVQPAGFVLAPGQSQAVTATVRVPANPEPGDHEVALVFLAPAGSTSANIKVNRGVATPVYITVAGATSNTASISNLNAPGFASGGPIHITAAVHNTGTVHRDFRGTTAIDIAGAGSTRFPDFTVMRDSTRDVSASWNPPLMCICHPKVTIVNADGTRHTASVRVIIFPVAQFAILLGALLLLVLAAFVFRRRYRMKVAAAAAALSRPVRRGDV